MLEVGPAGTASKDLPKREVFAEQASRLGKGLTLASPPSADWMDIGFADAARFEQQGFKKKSQAWESTLPQLDSGAQFSPYPSGCAKAASSGGIRRAWSRSRKW